MAASAVKAFVALIDERQQPPLRYTLGQLLARAKTADIAIAHLRVVGLDLTPSESGGLERCRVMVGHLDASVLFDAGVDDDMHERLMLLLRFARSGRLEMRTAPHHAWNPDFSIFSGLPGDRQAALIGAHYFGRPYPRFGLALTCVLDAPRALECCTARFDELWSAGYDVLPVVIETLELLVGSSP
jgi:hypothetical protein